MTRQNRNAIARRNLILYAGLGMLTMAIINRPSLLWFFLSKEGILEFLIAGFVTVFAAMSFHEIAFMLLKDNGWPWYTRPGGLVLLAFFLIAFFIFRYIFSNVFLPVFGITPNAFERSTLYQFFGMTFLWIIFLERIHCE